MAYSNFTLSEIEEKFGITNREQKIFPQFLKSNPSTWLLDTLEKASHLPIRSEKARSEAIVFPILTELCEKNKHDIIFYSGESLIADKKRSLTGECDFIVSKNTGKYDLNIPIFALLEAKKNDFDEGLPQCAAQMIGASVYNQKMKKEVNVIYGCVTTAEQWLFLKLENYTVFIDNEKYTIKDLDILLGVLQYIVDEVKVLTQ
jgi:hypothetical protein